MVLAMLENKTVSTVVRVLQVVFAFIVMGTCGYGVNVYVGYTEFVHKYRGGGSYHYIGVPNAWNFLIFCAVWTVLIVIFQFIVRNAAATRPLVRYICVAIELIALLSWFAGWIAVAVNIGTRACAKGLVACGALKAATVFGAAEWLLFMGTATMAISTMLNNKHKLGTSAA